MNTWVKVRSRTHLRACYHSDASMVQRWQVQVQVSGERASCTGPSGALAAAHLNSEAGEGALRPAQRSVAL